MRRQIMKEEHLNRYLTFLLALGLLPPYARAGESITSRAATQPSGYRGIWCADESRDERETSYRGGLATCSAQHVPMAYYAEKARKTFFVYGGAVSAASDTGGKLLIMASYYDHATGMVPRPTVVTTRDTGDARQNPALTLDAEGYVWVFAPGIGASPAAQIFRSVKPFDVSEFEKVLETTFSYPQPWYLDGQGFILPHARYETGPQIAAMTSADGRNWSEPQSLASISTWSSQVSGRFKNKIGTAFTRPQGNVILGTNLYYMESLDFGKTWVTAGKEKLDLPLAAPDSKALVFDYQSANWLVYVKDLNFDAAGNPTILCLTSRSLESGPGMRLWATARWTSKDWEISSLIQSDDNADTGCLHIEKRNVWRLIAPTDPGPEPSAPGGEIVMWTSEDAGRAWLKLPLTGKSPMNHNWVRRPVNAHPDFYAFWADGAVRRPSESRLYFATQEGKVFRLPTEMTEEYARPQPVELPLRRPPRATTVPARSESRPAKPD